MPDDFFRPRSSATTTSFDPGEVPDSPSPFRFLGSSLPRREFLSMGAASLATATLPRTRDARERGTPPLQVPEEGVAALTFDVFGTVVDWRGSIVREGRLFSIRNGIEVDWEEFADAWRRGYGPAMDRVRNGEIPWATIDQLHRTILDDLLVEFGIDGLSDQEKDHLNRIWHRLVPWPDAVAGLNRLRSRYILSTLSNGNVSLLTRMAKNAGLPWDVILSAELSGHYKPDPEVYLEAADLLDLPPRRIMMVAAHKGDLRAAGRVGFRTAWVPRPLEYGRDRNVDTSPDPEFDHTATDFLDLARRLGA